MGGSHRRVWSKGLTEARGAGRLESSRRLVHWGRLSASVHAVAKSTCRSVVTVRPRRINLWPKQNRSFDGSYKANPDISCDRIDSDLNKRERKSTDSLTVLFGHDTPRIRECTPRTGCIGGSVVRLGLPAAPGRAPVRSRIQGACALALAPRVDAACAPGRGSWVLYPSSSEARPTDRWRGLGVAGADP